jgi:hypothetical protein
MQPARPETWQGRTGAFLADVQWPYALGVVVIILAAAAPFWNVPLSRDQGVYATCADTLLRGGAPFRDCWDTKGPALHVTYAVARVVFGQWTGGAYVLNALFIAATALVLASLARRWFAMDLRWAYGIGLLYGLLAIIVRFDMNAQPESFANFFALLGLLTITRRVQLESRWGAYIAGALLTIAALYKYALLMPYGAAAIALIAFMPIEKPLRRWTLLAEMAGGAIAAGAVFALYLWVVGALGEALTHIQFIFLYSPKASA